MEGNKKKREEKKIDIKNKKKKIHKEVEEPRFQTNKFKLKKGISLILEEA